MQKGKLQKTEGIVSIGNGHKFDKAEAVEAIFVYSCSLTMTPWDNIEANGLPLNEEYLETFLDYKWLLYNF